MDDNDNDNDNDGQEIVISIKKMIQAKNIIRKATPAERMAALRLAETRARAAAREAFEAAAAAEAQMVAAFASNADHSTTTDTAAEARSAVFSAIGDARNAAHTANAGAHACMVTHRHALDRIAGRKDEAADAAEAAEAAMALAAIEAAIITADAAAYATALLVLRAAVARW